MSSWEIGDSVESVGGVLTADWLEEGLANKNWTSLTELSLPNSNLQKISLPPHYFSKLMTLDLSYNNLTTLTNLSALPRYVRKHALFLKDAEGLLILEQIHILNS
jgi:hypothetical protein